MGDAFPYADEAALRGALEAFYASSRYEELQDAYSRYSYYTGFLVDGDAGVRALWNTFNSTMPPNVALAASVIQAGRTPLRTRRLTALR